MQIQAIDCKVGVRCEIDGELYVCTDYVKRAMGRNPGFISVKLKNLRTGNVLDKRFRSGELVERVVFENRKMQYLYKDDTGFVFMDTETYEQFTLPAVVVEIGFATHPDDRKAIEDPATQKAIARALSVAISEYFQ